MKDRAIILAAGKGERLVGGANFPKPLKRVGGVPLIVRVLRNLERARIQEVGIVVGYLGDVLVDGIQRYRFDLKIRFIWNPEYEKPNGTSLLKARDFVNGPTFVMMSDHLWSPSLLEAVRRYPLHPDEAVLGVDYRIDRCFDIDDATKVVADGHRLVRIGKTLESFDALDTGVFRVTSALMDELEALNGPDGCSLSQGVAALAAKNKMHIADVGESTWIDVDTPEAHAHAEFLIARYGETLRPQTQSSQISAQL